MKAIAPILPPLLCLLLLSACIHVGNNAADDDASTGVGIDTQPEGPAVGVTSVSGNGATVAPADDRGRFAVGFPAQGGSPAADFTFAETSVADRMGLALDVSNTGRHPVRVFADINGDTWMRGYVTVPPGKTRTLYVLARLKTSATWPQIGTSDAPDFPGMHGIPGGRCSTGRASTRRGS